MSDGATSNSITKQPSALNAAPVRSWKGYAVSACIGLLLGLIGARFCPYLHASAPDWIGHGFYVLAGAAGGMLLSIAVTLFTRKSHSSNVHWLNWTFVAGSLAAFLLVGWTLQAGSPPTGVGPAPRYMLLLAAAAYVTGAVIGFLYAAIGAEVERFGAITAALTSAIIGFSLSDLSNPKGLSRELLQTLGNAVGEATPAGLVLALLVLFGLGGFLTMYVNKEYLLKPELLGVNELLDLQTLLNSLVSDLQPRPGIQSFEPIEVAGDTTKLQGQLDAMLKNPPWNDRRREYMASDAYKTISKALRFVKNHDACIEVLRAGRVRFVQDTDFPLYLAQTMIAANPKNPTVALPELYQLIGHPKAPILAWKLLGYALLFDTSRLKESIEHTKNYLAVVTREVGAFYNLACAHGQLHGVAMKDGDAAEGERNRLSSEALANLRKAASVNSEQVRKWLERDEEDDFASLKSDKDYQQIKDSLK